MVDTKKVNTTESFSVEKNSPREEKYWQEEKANDS